MLQHKHLITQLTKRQISEQYRGAWMGLFWSVLNPLGLLAIYTVVFAVVFKVKLDMPKAPTGARATFAIVLFCGLVTYSLFAASLRAAPGLVRNNRTFVKNMVFPLEVLPVVRLLSSLFDAAIGLGILFIAMASVGWQFTGQLLLLPVVWAPLLLLALGVGYGFAALGPYLPDLQHAVNLLITALLYLSGVFFQLQRLPEWSHAYALSNPLFTIIENTRRILLEGAWPLWGWVGYSYGVGFVCLWLGYALFTRVQKGFADVL